MSITQLRRAIFSMLIIAFYTTMTGCSTNSYEQPATPIYSPHEAIVVPATKPAPSYEPICLSPSLPDELIDQLQSSDDYRLMPEYPQGCTVIQPGSGDKQIGVWTYAVVAPFPTITDNLSLNDLMGLWSSSPPATIPFDKIFLTKDTVDFLIGFWGPPDEKNIRITNDHFLSDLAWKDRHALTILPFEKINSKWKVISVDGISPINKEFDADRYALNYPISQVFHHNEVTDLHHQNSELVLSKIGNLSNRDPEKLSTVILTGVTALVRGTASVMEINGTTYPGVEIRDILRNADVTHINNEVPFAINCPAPFPRENNLYFCSKPEYIELLTDLGTDVVELSGDHFQDWGDDAMLYTLNLYNENDMKYYGGGRNLEDGRKPLKLDLGSNHIALLGCNAKGPGYAGARENKPGAVLCDDDYLHQQIKELVSEGYLPIVTFQHLEYYDYTISPFLQVDFRGMAEAGAVIVSGSQAHQPQGIEFIGESLLHYGLGNLFFDQYNESFPTRQAFIDRHVFYDGRYINTELITIMFVDLAKPRLMTQGERKDVLNTVFTVSGWKTEFN